jgi:hypothetical protein
MTTDRHHRATAQAALEDLAAELNSDAFVTTLTLRPDHPPRLTVTSRLTRLGDAIHVVQHCYRSSHDVPIAAVDDPQAAARIVASMLRAIPPPADD